VVYVNWRFGKLDARWKRSFNADEGTKLGLQCCSLEAVSSLQVIEFTGLARTQQDGSLPNVEYIELNLIFDRLERGVLMDAGALEAVISKQMITAMKAHDAERTGTLRLIMTSLKNKSIEKRAPLSPAEEQQALATMIKQRRDSIEMFNKGNRPELAAKEAGEIVVIEEFLPKALDEAGLRGIVDEAIAAQTAESGQKPTPKEMGLVIKRVQARLQTDGVRAEGRLVSEAVKAALAG
jgi:uncharacterized protein